MNRYLSALLALCLLVLGGLAQAQGQYVTYLHPDIQGSPLVATDEQGALQWHEDYEPWGARQVKEANSASNGRGSKVWYTGKEEEASLGLYYYGARWYAPDVGQFYSIDPAAVTLDNPRSFNRYAYANNNPILYLDPDGRQSQAEGWSALGERDPHAPLSEANRAVGHGMAAVGRAIEPDAASVAAPVGLGVVAKILGRLKQIVRAGGQSSEVVKEIEISRAKYGEAAEHIADAQRAGHPSVLTIYRPGAGDNRGAAIGGVPKVKGKQLDEYPPAMFKEGGAGASVRAVDPGSNMGVGACIGNACRMLPDGAKVRIKVVD